MTPREPARSGDEQDWIAKGWRRVICRFQRAGVGKAIKRAIRRRERKHGQREARGAA